MAGEPQGADAITTRAAHAPAATTSGVNVLLAGLSVKFSFKLVRFLYLHRDTI